MGEKGNMEKTKEKEEKKRKKEKKKEKRKKDKIKRQNKNQHEASQQINCIPGNFPPLFLSSLSSLSLVS